LIRSEKSCRLDLRRWGAKFEANSQRPHFEGHERDDVVKHRNEFINYFLAYKDYYYTITDDEIPMLNFPTQNLHRILICGQSIPNVLDTTLLCFFLFVLPSS
jgi:hypothetical protein